MTNVTQIRTLSSAYTMYWKFVVPTFICIFVFGILVMTWLIFRPQSLLPFVGMLGIVLLSNILLILLIRGCTSLKRIRIDEKNLYISNYIHEIIVPLTAIEDVLESYWSIINPVTIYFSAPTQFGERVTFMPKVRLFSLFCSHPVVAELRQYIVQPE